MRFACKTPARFLNPGGGGGASGLKCLWVEEVDDWYEGGVQDRKDDPKLPAYVLDPYGLNLNDDKVRDPG